MAKYRVLLHATVLKELRRIPAATRRKVKAAIDGLATDPIPVGAGRLRGRESAYRLRVGDYRIVYEVVDAQVIGTLIRIGRQRDVYRAR